MTAPRSIQEASLRLVSDRQGTANEHKSMLKERYISVSQLVKHGAEDLANIILADEPDGSSHWGFYGNARADWNLENVPFQEHKLVVPLDEPGEDEEFPGVNLEGHYDGLDIRASIKDQVTVVWDRDGEIMSILDHEPRWYATIYENKAPLHDPTDPHRINQYYEQGAAYLAMLDEMSMAGVRELEPADWKQEEGRLTLPKDLEVCQVVVAVQPASGDKFEEAYPETQDHLARHLDKLRAKGKAVWASVEAKEPTGAAREWDLKHTKLRSQVPVITEDEAEAAMRALFMVRDSMKKLEKDKEFAQGVLQKYLMEFPERKAKVLGVTVKIQETAGGVRHFIQKPYWAVQTWGKIKEPEPEEASEETDAEEAEA